MTEVTQQVTNIIEVGSLKEVKEPFDFQFIFLGSSLSLEWQTTSCTYFPSNFMHIFPFKLRAHLSLPTSCTSFPSLPYPEDFRSNAGHRSKSYINCLTSFNIDLLCTLSCFSCVRLFESHHCGLSPHPMNGRHGLSPTRLCIWGFSRQEYWSGLPCLPPGDLPDPGIKLPSLTSLALAGKFFTTSTTQEAPDTNLTYP